MTIDTSGLTDEQARAALAYLHAVSAAAIADRDARHATARLQACLDAVATADNTLNRAERDYKRLVPDWQTRIVEDQP